MIENEVHDFFLDYVYNSNILARGQNHIVILNDLFGEWLKTACGADTLPANGEELASFYCIASSHLLRFLEPLTQEQVMHSLIFDVDVAKKTFY